MRFQVIAALAVASLAFAGCAANTDETATSSDEALSATLLVGAYDIESQSTGDFGHLVLRADGSYLAETIIMCIKAPCNNPREEGHWTSSSFSHTTIGTLKLHPNHGGTRSYSVSVAQDGTGMKLGRHGNIAYYDRVPTWCDLASDCDGQPVKINTQMCMVGYTHKTLCQSNACVVKCAPIN